MEAATDHGSQDVIVDTMCVYVYLIVCVSVRGICEVWSRFVCKNPTNPITVQTCLSSLQQVTIIHHIDEHESDRTPTDLITLTVSPPAHNRMVPVTFR